MQKAKETESSSLLFKVNGRLDVSGPAIPAPSCDTQHRKESYIMKKVPWKDEPTDQL